MLYVQMISVIEKKVVLVSSSLKRNIKFAYNRFLFHTDKTKSWDDPIESQYLQTFLPKPFAIWKNIEINDVGLQQFYRCIYNEVKGF